MSRQTPTPEEHAAKLEARRQRYATHKQDQADQNRRYWIKRLAAEHGFTPEEMEALLTAAQKRKERKAAKQAD